MAPAHREIPSCTASAAWCTGLLLLSAACGRGTPQGDQLSLQPKAPQPSAQANAAPPSAEFVAPTTWSSWREGIQPVAPPDLSHETWRVFANRELPIQKETPVWQPLAADKLFELQMPAGSSYRCIVNPIEITPQVNDWGTELEGWQMLRALLCSSDNWQTWTEYPHRMLLSKDGTRTVAYASEASLRERTKTGQVYYTTVLLRSDKEERQATTGPARIIASTGPVD